jgi:co-chaperonin GroES (HSP10)
MQGHDIKPLSGKYYCEIIEDGKVLFSGILLPDNVKEVPHRAKVLAAGKDVVDKKGKVIKQSAKAGDIVHFKRVWDRQPKGAEQIFVKEDEIVGIER